jgi:ATP-binding cassette subfamily B (MDR/TAP) protein 1
LSTIKSADKIIVLSGGRLVEQGTHNELLDMDGTYTKLAMTQKVNSDRENPPREDEFSRVIHHELELDSVDNESVSPPVVEKHSSDTLHANTDALETLEHPGKHYPMGTLLKFVSHLHKNSKSSILQGMLWSIQAGAGAPIQAVFLAKCLTTLARPPSEYTLLRSEINLWAGMHVVLAFVQLLAYTGQSFTLGASTERLIRHVSGPIFRTLLDKDMTFFDMSEHGVGALVSFISTEPSSIAGMGCYSMGQYVMAFTTLIGAIATSIAVGWKLGLVGSATVPVLLVCGLLRYRVMGQLEARLRKSYQEAASLAGEAISSIRTVVSLNRERDISASFHDQLAQQDSRSIRTSLTSSTLFAFSQSASMLCTALGLWYGGTLVISGEYGLLQFILSFAAINICGDSAGSIFSSSPDLAKAKQSTTRLKALLEEKSQEYMDCAAARPLLEGVVKFRDVHFRYPTRPERRILNGFDLTVQKGKYVALVGSNGCGKSTIVAFVGAVLSTY